MFITACYYHLHMHILLVLQVILLVLQVILDSFLSVSVSEDLNKKVKEIVIV